jgi:dTDP-4-amino-4,6-dideoxygalactose transaminase
MRVLPPVYSPLTALALARAGGAVNRDALLSQVEGRIRDTFSPLHTTITDSGTSALRLALEAASAAGLAPIAFPAYNCYDLVSAARGAEVDPIYYDVDPATLGPVGASVTRAMDMGARTVLVAHLFGIPVDLDSVRARCEPHGALLIEDAAQGVGGDYGGRPLGALGDLSVLSFSRGKGRTGGGGGALLANTDAGLRLGAHLRALKPAGKDRGVVPRAFVQWALSRPGLYALPRALPFLHLGETRYREPVSPAEMGRRSAALLANVWDLSDAEGEVRRERAAEYRTILDDVPGLTLPRLPERSHGGYLRFPVIPPQASTAGLEAGQRLGVAGGYPGILPHVHPEAGDRMADDLPGARLLADRLCTLPTHRFVNCKDISRICTLIADGG